MCPALSLLAPRRCFLCLPSPSCAGDGWCPSEASYVAPFLQTVRLEALELHRVEVSPYSAIRSCGGLCMSGMSAGELCEAPCSFVHAVCVLASDRSRKSHWGVFLAFVCFYAFCRFRRAGMSNRVYPYSLSGCKSIDWVPGVPLAAWGGPGRTQGAVRAAPKTRNSIPRVKVSVRIRAR